ncbi:conserved putative small membrane protein [unidentified eubacterium SCB49]|nr:conserved putative small membrane protein [unidentified eubacterium SCB49]
MNKKIVGTAAILVAITIAIGAFGAHGLKKLVDASSLTSFETGVRYQMYHALALFVIGLAATISEKLKKRVFWLFLFGILLFSGSIYLLSLQAVLPFAVKRIAFLTPIGGFLFIIGWVWLAIGLFRSDSSL